MDFAIGGIRLALLIIGIVEAAKEFGLAGKASRVLALCLGIVLSGTAWGLQSGLIPAAAEPYITWVVIAIAGGLAAMGYYDLGKRFSGR